ncbi:MAG: hypothetical protein AAB365_02435 [Patescibacteria group bacterium]
MSYELTKIGIVALAIAHITIRGITATGCTLLPTLRKTDFIVHTLVSFSIYHTPTYR